MCSALHFIKFSTTIFKVWGKIYGDSYEAQNSYFSYYVQLFTLATFNTSYTAANSGSDSQDTEYEIAPGSEEDEQAVYSSSEDAKILETIREIDGCHEEEKHLRIAVPPLELNEKDS